MLARQGPTEAKKFVVVLLKICISGGLLFTVLSKTGIRKVTATLEGINLQFLIAASLIYIVTIFLSSVRWRFLLSKDYELRKLFSFYMIGSFFNNILPGIIGGDAIKAYYLYRDSGKSGPAIASVFLDRYIGFSALMALGLMAYPFGFRYFRNSYIEWALPVIVTLFILASFLIVVLRIGKRFQIVSGLYDYIALFRSRRSVLAKTFSISIVIQILNILAVSLVSTGLEIAIPLLPLFIFVPIIATLATAPVSISGLGVREASFVLLFGFLGISPVQATAISFGWFLSVVVGSLPGFFEYLRYKKDKGHS